MVRFDQTVAGFYNWLAGGHLTAGSASKPYMLAEYGSVEGGAGAKGQWFRGEGSTLPNRPRIKAVVYYNYHQGFSQVDVSRMSEHTFLNGGQVNYVPNVNDGDSRLVADSGAGWRALFARRLASRRYISVVQGVPTPTP